jgi:DNA-binding transcriptional LysR family regulator
MDVVHASALGGLGVAMLPAFRCVEELRAGRLERVLPAWTPPPTPIHIVYPTARHVSPTVRAFVEHVQKRMTPPPWELGPKP